MDYFDSIVLTVAAVVSYRKDLSDLIYSIKSAHLDFFEYRNYNLKLRL